MSSCSSGRDDGKLVSCWCWVTTWYSKPFSRFLNLVSCVILKLGRVIVMLTPCAIMPALRIPFTMLFLMSAICFAIQHFFLWCLLAGSDGVLWYIKLRMHMYSLSKSIFHRGWWSNHPYVTWKIHPLFSTDESLIHDFRIISNETTSRVGPFLLDDLTFICDFEACLTIMLWIWVLAKSRTSLRISRMKSAFSSMRTLKSGLAISVGDMSDLTWLANTGLFKSRSPLISSSGCMKVALDVESLACPSDDPSLSSTFRLREP